MDYSYQKPIIKNTLEKLFTHKKVVLAACPGAGKTRMTLEVIRRFLKEKPHAKILVLTHGQLVLRKQWIEVASQEFDDVIEIGKHTEVAPQNNHHIYISLPQSYRKLEVLGRIDLLVIDEAHHFVNGDQVKKIIQLLKPTYQLRLTGTPALYVQDSEWTIIGITIQELLSYGTLVDPDILLLESEHPIKLEHYSDSYSLNPNVRLDDTKSIQNVHKVLSLLINRLSNGQKQIGKTMIACHSQNQARAIHHYIKEKTNFKSIISISDLCEGTYEFSQFKTDVDVTFFLVVCRGILGFDYPALETFVDMTETLNVNRIFQMLCRVIRSNPNKPHQKKTFLKLFSKDVSTFAYTTMSFTVALSDPRYYFTYSIKYSNSGNAAYPKGEFPIKREFINAIEREPNVSVESLPKLLTFQEIKDKDKDVRLVGKTNFAYVSSLLNTGSPNRWTFERAIEIAKKCKTYTEFSKTSSGAVQYLLRNFPNEFYSLFPRQRVLWTDEAVKHELASVKNWKDLVCNHRNLYQYLLRNGKSRMFDYLRPKHLKPLKTHEAVAICKKIKDLGTLRANRAYETLQRKNKLYLIEAHIEKIRKITPLTHDVIEQVKQLEKTMGRSAACQKLGVNYQAYYARTARKDRIST